MIVGILIFVTVMILGSEYISENINVKSQKYKSFNKNTQTIIFVYEITNKCQIDLQISGVKCKTFYFDIDRIVSVKPSFLSFEIIGDVKSKQLLTNTSSKVVVHCLYDLHRKYTVRGTMTMKLGAFIFHLGKPKILI